MFGRPSSIRGLSFATVWVIDRKQPGSVWLASDYLGALPRQREWRRDGVWADLMETLRQLERRRQGRQPEPSAGSMDSQSIKTAIQGSEVGFDGGKKSKGRKRHLLVDTLGLNELCRTKLVIAPRFPLTLTLSHPGEGT